MTDDDGRRRVVLRADWAERRSSRTVRWVRAYRLVDAVSGRDVVQPWFRTSTEAKRHAQENNMLVVSREGVEK